MSDTRDTTKQAFEHADWVCSDNEMIARYRQAAAAERADAFQLPEIPDMTNYLNPVCRGSLALGNACRTCERCLEELKRLEGFGSAPVYSLEASKATNTETHSHQGLPVAGYKKEQPAWAVDLVNINKALEEAVLRQVDHLKEKFTAEVDQRQVALARTKLEEAFYHLNRGIFQPSRLFDGPQADQADAILRAVGSQAALSSEALSIKHSK